MAYDSSIVIYISSYFYALAARWLIAFTEQWDWSHHLNLQRQIHKLESIELLLMFLQTIAVVGAL